MGKIKITGLSALNTALPNIGESIKAAIAEEQKKAVEERLGEAWARGEYARLIYSLGPNFRPSQLRKPKPKP